MPHPRRVRGPVTGFELRPRRGELVASLVARYAAMLHVPVTPAFRRLVLGREVVCRSLLLPTKLADCEGRPPFGRLSALELVRDHTAVPYYASFLTTERVESLERAILHGWGRTTLQALGITFVHGHASLNYCRACRREATVSHGADAWLLRHQMPGVFRCAEHDEPLWASRFPCKALYNEFVPCPSNDRGAYPLYAGVEPSLAGKLARLTDEFLSHTQAPLTDNGLRVRAKAMLQRAGWIHETGFVRQGATAAFEGLFGGAFLERVGCELGDPAWFHDMVGAKTVRHHPLRYILLIAFADATMGDFFALIPEEPLERKVVLERPSPERLRGYRKSILARFAPGASRREVRLASTKRFRLMLAFDSEWLDRNFPLGPPQVRRRPSKDQEYLNLLKGALERLRDRPGEVPIKIRPGALLREAGLPAYVRSYAGTPLSSAFLHDSTETPDSFMLRKLMWHAALLRRSGERTTYSVFLKRVNSNRGDFPHLFDVARSLFDDKVTDPTLMAAIERVGTALESLDGRYPGETEDGTENE